jgi:hypothetical protein
VWPCARRPFLTWQAHTRLLPRRTIAVLTGQPPHSPRHLLVAGVGVDDSREGRHESCDPLRQEQSHRLPPGARDARVAQAEEDEVPGHSCLPGPLRKPGAAPRRVIAVPYILIWTPRFDSESRQPGSGEMAGGGASNPPGDAGAGRSRHTLSRTLGCWIWSHGRGT